MRENMEEIPLPRNLKFCRENPFKAGMTFKRFQEILCDIFGTENLTKRKYTEKYTGIKLVLFYYKGEHMTKERMNAGGE